MMTTIALAADRSGGDGQKPEPDVYQPVTSDLMNAFIQPRHIKLWLAGEAQNWEYAEYERHNIGGALRRLATAIPTYQGQSTDSLITAFATPQLDALETSIKAKDPAAFKTASANPVERNHCKARTVVRVPGTWNTLVQASSIGNRK